jgi:DNA processing protein
MALIDWLTLSLTTGIGPILSRRIVEAAGGDVAAACSASLALLRNVEGIGTTKADKIATGLMAARPLAVEQLDRASRLNVRIVCTDDSDYPLLLREIPDPPIVLHVRGTLEPRDLQAVAIVGSRKCSHYGREQAERFGALLGGNGICVVSGGARGIDSAAHRGAMNHPHGRTIAVLGSGVDVPYPPENAKLFDQIADGRGAVVSEFPLGTQPTAENFPRRNRIVSGMSRGVLVVEADEKSGALITARQCADDHNRTVFAVPGRVDNPMSAGPHKLIRDGATLARNLDDILEGLTPLSDRASEIPAGLFASPTNGDESATNAGPPAEPPPAAAPASAPSPVALLSTRQSLILQQFNGEPLSVDFLIEQTALPAPVILQELTMLSLRGLVKRVDGQTYAKGRAAR